MHIAEKEGADLDIIRPAALLHDIARHKEDIMKGKICHALEGARMAGDILREYDYDEDYIKKISHCIECHRFRNQHIPQTLEAKIIYDADKLDAIGAVGLGRAFLFSGEVGARLHNKDVDVENTSIYSNEDTAYREFLEKLSKIKDRMLTETGRKIAQGRHDFMEEFFKRMNKEVDGLL